MNILYKYILPFIIFVIFFTIAKVGMREFFSYNSSNTYESNVISLDVCKDISSACYKSDLIIIHTEWNEFKLLNFKKIVMKKQFIIYDMRNIYSPVKMYKDKIKYFSIGR